MRITVLCIFIFIWNGLSAQNYSLALPKPGDVQYSCEYLGRIEPFMLPSANNKEWNFSFLSSNWSIVEEYASADKSRFAEYFPEATLVLFKANGEEEFFKIQDGSLYSFGKKIAASYNDNGYDFIRYSPLRRIINTSKKVGLGYVNTYTLNFKIAKKDITKGISFFPAGVDSIFLEIDHTETCKIKSEVNVLYSNEFKKAQRHEFEVTQHIKIGIKSISGKEWILIPQLNSSLLPSEIIQILAKTKSNRTDYISPEYKGVMLSYEDENSSKISNVKYQDSNPAPYYKTNKYNTADMIASPNPTTGTFTINLFNQPFDDYTIKFYNVMGHEVTQKKYSRKDGNMLVADISYLKRGTYMYSLINSNQQKLMTKRVGLIGL